MLDAAVLFVQAQRERAFAEGFNDDDQLAQAWLAFVITVEEACKTYLAVADRTAADD